MFIQLSEPMEYRGTKYKKGDTVEVGAALGERLILNGHKKTTADTPSNIAVILSDTDVDALKYKDAEKLVKEFKLTTDDKKFDTFKSALKIYFADKRGE